MAPPSNILFVSGTDTGIGKTFTASLLVRALRAKNINVLVSKPVETGCLENEQGELVAEDAECLRESAGGTQPIEEVVPYRFAAPAAPNAAAALESKEVDFEAVCEHLRGLAARADLLLVEGAGGLLVPLDARRTFADVCTELNASALLVIGSRLGCINHSLLSVEVLKGRGIPLLGYVINDLFASESSAERERYPQALSSNREVIREAAAAYSAKELLFLPFTEGDFSLESPEIAAFSEAIIEYFRLSR